MADNNKYIKELDGIRAVSILLVLATHLLPVGPSELQLNSMTGPMGMSLFFCLSGFLITRFLYESSDIKTFFTRRIARVFPVLLIYAFIVAILLYNDVNIFISIIAFFINYSDGSIVKGVSHLWSICIEMHFYVAIGLVVWIAGRKGFWIVPIMALIVLFLRIHAEAYTSIRTHLRIDEILVGSMLALIWLQPEKTVSRVYRIVVSRAFWIILPIWMLASHSVGAQLNYIRPYMAMALVGSILFMKDGYIRHVCRHPWLSYLAKISYALYIWHPLMSLGWLGHGDRWTLYLLKRPITFLLTFICAHYSTFMIERRFTQMVRSRIKR